MRCRSARRCSANLYQLQATTIIIFRNSRRKKKTEEEKSWKDWKANRWNSLSSAIRRFCLTSRIAVYRVYRIVFILWCDERNWSKFEKTNSWRLLSARFVVILLQQFWCLIRCVCVCYSCFTMRAESAQQQPMQEIFGGCQEEFAVARHTTIAQWALKPRSTDGTDAQTDFVNLLFGDADEQIAELIKWRSASENVTKLPWIENSDRSLAASPSPLFRMWRIFPVEDWDGADADINSDVVTHACRTELPKVLLLPCCSCL